MAWSRLSAGWRALIGLWMVLALALAGGAGWLAHLGPPDPPPAERVAAATTAAAPDDPPPAATPPAAAQDAAAASAAVVARQAAPAAVVTAPAAAGASPPPPVGPPGAPEPPALRAPSGGAEARGASAAAEHVIPPPDPELLEEGPHGPLPRIGPQGRTSIRTYGRPFDRRDPRPRIGLVIGGLGLNAAVTEDAIRRLPVGVALAFSPYAPAQAEFLLTQARARGMEVLLALPLEPAGYPLNNPGNRALLVGQAEAETQDRLDWSLARLRGYVGAVGAHGPMRGEGFARLPDRLGALQAALAARGLLYIDPRPGAPPPARAWGRTVDLVVDEPATRGEIALKLEALERLARERGSALGYAGEASPVLVERVAAWAAELEAKGLALVPVTALIRAPAAPEAGRGGAPAAAATTATTARGN